MTAVDRARMRVSNGKGPTCSSQPCGREIFTLEEQIKLICNLASHSCQRSLTETLGQRDQQNSCCPPPGSGHHELKRQINKDNRECLVSRLKSGPRAWEPG